MRIRKPSPAMVVACTALFVAMGGTSIAAVNFARNAGHVDGKNAYKSTASNKAVANDLVATNSRGKIPGRFLDDVPLAVSFGKAAEVGDNATGVPTTLIAVPGIGNLSATCVDQNQNPGVEDPLTTISLANSSGTTINLAKRIGGANAQVVPHAPDTVQTVDIGGSNTFEMQVQNRNQHLLIDGVVRQDGRGTPTGSCVFYGTIMYLD